MGAFCINAEKVIKKSELNRVNVNRHLLVCVFRSRFVCERTEHRQNHVAFKNLIVYWQFYRAYANERAVLISIRLYLHEIKWRQWQITNTWVK